MKKILFLLLFFSIAASAQIKICNLPSTSTGTLHDYFIKEDSTCGIGSGGTKKISIADFLSAYGIGTSGGSYITNLTALPPVFSSGGSTPLVSIRYASVLDSGALHAADFLNFLNSVDTIYKNSSRDSFIFEINHRRYPLKDSVGAGAGSGWATSGNTGTNATTNYLGTNDTASLTIRVNATQRIKIVNGGGIYVDNLTGTGKPVEIFSDVMIVGRTAISPKLQLKSVGAGTGNPSQLDFYDKYNNNATSIRAADSARTSRVIILPDSIPVIGKAFVVKDTAGGKVTLMYGTVSGGGGGSIYKQSIIDTLNNIDPDSITFNNNVSVFGANSGVTITTSGELILCDDLDSNSCSIIRSIHIQMQPAAVQGLGKHVSSISVVENRPGYVTTITDGFCTWTGGTGVGYDNMSSLYFYVSSRTSNQFQIDCPSTSNTNMQSGVKTQCLYGSKGNVDENQKVYMTKDGVSSQGDAILDVFLLVKETQQR